jgi:hypothetical protein
MHAQNVLPFTHTTAALSRTKSATSRVCVRACAVTPSLHLTHAHLDRGSVRAQCAIGWRGVQPCIALQIVICAITFSSAHFRVLVAVC